MDGLMAHTRMLYTIFGVFLAVPLLTFGWKETRGVLSTLEMMGSVVRPRLNVYLTERDRLRATWMERWRTVEVPTTESNKTTTSPMISIQVAQINATTEISMVALID